MGLDLSDRSTSPLLPKASGFSTGVKSHFGIGTNILNGLFHDLSTGAVPQPLPNHYHHRRPSCSVVHTRLMLLHDSRNDDGIKSFFQEVHELYIKTLMNPLYLPGSRITSSHFDTKETKQSPRDSFTQRKFDEENDNNASTRKEKSSGKVSQKGGRRIIVVSARKLGVALWWIHSPEFQTKPAWEFQSSGYQRFLK
ncbi:transport protein particle 20 kDa subunit-like [Forsythia ovata]|uniref:Transport protein particle 20 kDa subunit-like n=1 Tax=Forsythia ovata TaxID=205694 RepID=A0ABD1WRV3_9LAMI